MFVYYSSTETSVITASTATAGLAPASSSATSSGNMNIFFEEQSGSVVEC